MGEGEGKGSRDRQKRLLLIFLVCVAVAGALAVLLFLLDGDGGETTGSNRAHVNLDVPGSSTYGVALDERKGVPPPPVRQANAEKAAKEAGCFLRLNINFATNPPTFADRIKSDQQQADGAYLETPGRAARLNSLDHGRLEIQYALDLPEHIQLRLKGLYDTMYGGTLLFPNYEMTEWGLAATTWTNFLGCPGWAGDKTLDAIRAFGKATWGKDGREPVSASEIMGPTPADPEEPAPRNSSQAR
jgi:hypothetical protein